MLRRYRPLCSRCQLGFVALAVALAAGAAATAYTDLPLSVLQLFCYGLALCLLTLAATLFDRDAPAVRGRPTAPFTRLDASLLALVTIPALALRVLHIDSIPRVILSDEINHLDNALGILDGHLVSPFISGDWDTVYLHLYTIAASVLLLPDRQLALRVVGIIPGVLSVPLLYLFMRHLFGRAPAFFAAMLLALSSWHILLSRYGYHWAINGFAVCLTLYWLARALQTQRLRHFLFAGFSLGLGVLYTNAATLMPVAVVLFAGYLLLVHKPMVTRHVVLGFALLVTGAAVVVGPRLSTVTVHPDMMARHRFSSVLNPLWGGHVADMITRQFEEILVSFNYHTDAGALTHPRPAGEPLLDAMSATAFGLGVFYALFGLRRRGWALLLLTFLILVSPAALSTGQTTWATAYRACAVPPVLCALAAGPFAVLWQRGASKAARTTLMGLLALVFVTIAAVNYHDYFDVFPSLTFWHDGWEASETWAARQVLAAPADRRELVSDDLTTWMYLKDLTFRRRSYETFVSPVPDPLPPLLTATLHPTEVLASSKRGYGVGVGDTLIDLLAYYYPGGTRRDTLSTSGTILDSAYLLQPQQMRRAYGLTVRPPPDAQAPTGPSASAAAAWRRAPTGTFPFVADMSGTLIVPSNGIYALTVSGSRHSELAIDGRPFTRGYLSAGLHGMAARVTVRGPGHIGFLWGHDNGPQVPMPASQVLRQGLPSWGLVERQTPVPGGGTLERWVPALWFDSGGHPPALQPLREMEWTTDMAFPAPGEYQFHLPTQATAHVWIDGQPLSLMPGAADQWPAHLTSGWHRVRIAVATPSVEDFHFYWQAPDGQSDVSGGPRTPPPRSRAPGRPSSFEEDLRHAARGKRTEHDAAVGDVDHRRPVPSPVRAPHLPDPAHVIGGVR
jgi:4-amino-4-deoxy-L-arabinose transferase-like glycosyltransferase